MESLLQIPTELSKVTSMANRSLRIVFDTQENLTEEQMARIMGQLGKTGWMTFSPERPVEPADLVSLPELTFDKDEKTPGQRLRASLFVLWQQKGKQGEFLDFYSRQMERFIDAVKNRLDEVTDVSNNSP